MQGERRGEAKGNRFGVNAEQVGRIWSSWLNSLNVDTSTGCLINKVLHQVQVTQGRGHPYMLADFSYINVALNCVF